MSDIVTFRFETLGGELLCEIRERAAISGEPSNWEALQHPMIDGQGTLRLTVLRGDEVLMQTTVDLRAQSA